MTKQNIKIIKNGFLVGMAYAIAMATVNYFRNENFSLWEFLFNFAFFGIAMALVNRNSFKK